MNKILQHITHLSLKIGLLLAFMLGSVGLVRGQVSSYSFTQTTGTYTGYTGGTGWTQILNSRAVTADDNNYPTTGTYTIPFTFYFNGTLQANYVINSNGFITFGTTAPATNEHTPISTSTTFNGCVSGLGEDINLKANGTISNCNVANNGTTVNLSSGTIPTWLKPGTVVFNTSRTSQLDANTYVTAINSNTQFTISSGANETRTGNTLTFYSTICTQILGSTPNRILAVQFSNVGEYQSSGSNILGNYYYQIILNEHGGTNSDKIQIVYGTMANSGGDSPQVGLRGATNADYRNFTGNTWSSPTTGIVNTAAMTLTTTYYPASGQTYTFTPCALSTAPTSITGTSSICPGGSTLLTTSGGSLGTDAKDIWYEGACATEAYTNEWATQPFATTNTAVNSVTGGILNVTSINNDPMIDMTGLGTFDPNTFRYIQIYYQVTSGNGSSAEIFFYNTTHNFAVGGEEVAGALISDGAWHFLNFDMWSDPDYKTGGNITGWRFDWAGESGVTMNIDFITLANQPLIGLGTSVTVSPATPATYFTRKKGGCNSTVCVSRLVTLNADATLTLTSGNASPIVCKNSAITDIVFTVGGAGTGASVTSGSLPTGVTGTYNSTAKTFTISGIPTSNATFPFTVTTSGSSCINPSLSGTITVNALPAFTKSFTDITCFDAGNGTITISATGGSGTGYEYSINGGSNWQTGGNYTGLGPATYTIKVKDSNNCIQTICQ